MLRKIVTDWNFFLSFPGQFKARILAFKFVAATMNRCHPWQVRVMAPAGPLWLLGLNNIPPQGFRGGRRQEGQPQQVSTLRACSPHSFSLLCNYHQRTSVCCSSGSLPLTSVLASPWPIRSIVVDVMTKNKQCEGVRLPFVWTGRFPSLLLRGRISPNDTTTSSLCSSLLTGTWIPTGTSVVYQMWSKVNRLTLLPGI